MITRCKYITLMLFFFFNGIYAQEKYGCLTMGVYFGLGDDLGSVSYSYKSRYIKIQFSTVVKESKIFKYLLFIQPQKDYIEYKRGRESSINVANVSAQIQNIDEYNPSVFINDYRLNFGLIISKRIADWSSVFLLVSAGPMITDTETDRLSKGFAFANILSLGVSFKIGKTQIELRPNFSHISNASLQKINGGYNSFNFDFGLIYPL